MSIFLLNERCPSVYLCTINSVGYNKFGKKPVTMESIYFLLCIMFQLGILKHLGISLA